MFLVCNFCNLWELWLYYSWLPNFFLKFGMFFTCVCISFGTLVECVVTFFLSMSYLLTWILLGCTYSYSIGYDITYVPLVDWFIFSVRWLTSYVYYSTYILRHYSSILYHMFPLIGPYCQHLCTLFTYVPWHMLFDVHTNIDLSFSP